MTISVKVFKRPAVPVEGLYLSMADGTGTIGFAERHKKIDVSYMPQNASYPACQISIEKIFHPDGSEYEDDLSQYATIEDGRYLSTTDQLELGAAIRIVATTNAEGFRSNPFTVYVARIPIKRLYLYADFGQSYITLGESLRLNEVSVYPENATYNILNEQATATLLTPDLGTLEKTDTGYLLIATEDMSAYDHVSYNTFSDTPNYGPYVNISDEGVLTVSDRALLGLEVMFGVTVGFGGRYHYAQNSKTHRVIVQKQPLESITLSIETNDVVKGEVYFITRELFPANADYSSSKYYLLEDIEGIMLSKNMFLVTTAPGGTVFHVQVEIDGVKSNILELTVIEVPLEQLTISLGTDQVSSWQIYEIKVTTQPNFADYEELTFMLLDEIDGIYLSGNKLFISPEVKSGTVFRIQAVADGIKSNILTLTVVNEE